MPLPMFGPAPVTRATLPSSEISTLLLSRSVAVLSVRHGASDRGDGPRSAPAGRVDARGAGRPPARRRAGRGQGRWIGCAVRDHPANPNGRITMDIAALRAPA